MAGEKGLAALKAAKHALRPEPALPSSNDSFDGRAPNLSGSGSTLRIRLRSSQAHARLRRRGLEWFATRRPYQYRDVT